MEETIQVPKNFFDKFLEKFNTQPEPQPEPTPEPVVVTETDEYKAVAVERDEYKAKWEAHEKELERAALIEKFEGELKETKADPELAELLANMPEETAEAVLKQFKALSAQIETPALEEELGSNGEAIEDPAAAFNAAVLAIQAENKVAYNTALEMAKVNHKELFAAYMKAKE